MKSFSFFTILCLLKIHDVAFLPISQVFANISQTVGYFKEFFIEELCRIMQNVKPNTLTGSKINTLNARLKTFSQTAIVLT